MFTAQRLLSRFGIPTGATASLVNVVDDRPSDDCTLSIKDIELTKRLFEAGEIIGIDVLDHLIIGKRSHLSLKSEGLL